MHYTLHRYAVVIVYENVQNDIMSTAEVRMHGPHFDSTHPSGPISAIKFRDQVGAEHEGLGRGDRDPREGERRVQPGGEGHRPLLKRGPDRPLRAVFAPVYRTTGGSYFIQGSIADVSKPTSASNLHTRFDRRCIEADFCK